MMGPPTNSAAVNCQPSNSARMMPSSTTRLVDAISNAIAAVKCAPLRNSERASATAAYEHDDDAIPSPVAMARVRGRSSPSRRTIVDLRTTACTTADSAKPRISAHSISHVIDPATNNACPIASMRHPPVEPSVVSRHHPAARVRATIFRRRGREQDECRDDWYRPERDDHQCRNHAAGPHHERFLPSVLTVRCGREEIGVGSVKIRSRPGGVR